MKKTSSSRRKNNPTLMGTWRPIFAVFYTSCGGRGFLLFDGSQRTAYSLKSNLPVVFGLLLAVGGALCLNPVVQQTFRAWERARRDGQEKQFWKNRDINDARQAGAQARVEAQRKQRMADTEGRIATLAEAEAKAAAAQAEAAKNKPV